MLREPATVPPESLCSPPSVLSPEARLGKNPACTVLTDLTVMMKESGFYFLLPSILTLSVALKTYLCHWFVTQDEPEPAIRKSYQAVERHGETIRVRDTVLLKSGPRKTSTPYVAKISALWENPESGTCSSDWEPKEQLSSVWPRVWPGTRPPFLAESAHPLSGVCLLWRL